MSDPEEITFLNGPPPDRADHAAHLPRRRPASSSTGPEGERRRTRSRSTSLPEPHPQGAPRGDPRRARRRRRAAPGGVHRGHVHQRQPSRPERRRRGPSRGRTFHEVERQTAEATALVGVRRQAGASRRSTGSRPRSPGSTATSAARTTPPSSCRPGPAAGRARARPSIAESMAAGIAQGASITPGGVSPRPPSADIVRGPPRRPPRALLRKIAFKLKGESGRVSGHDGPQGHHPPARRRRPPPLEVRISEAPLLTTPDPDAGASNVPRPAPASSRWSRP